MANASGGKTLKSSGEVAILASNGPPSGLVKIVKIGVSKIVKTIREGVKIVREKIPKWLNYLSSSTVFPPLDNAQTHNGPLF